MPRPERSRGLPPRARALWVVWFIVLAGSLYAMIRLIDLDVLLFLQPTDLADTSGPLVQQTHEHFVHTVDIASQIFQGHERYVRDVAHALFRSRT